MLRVTARCPLADDFTRVRASASGVMSHASECDDGRKLVVGPDAPYEPTLDGNWGLIDSSDGEELYLLRHEVEAGVENGYVLVRPRVGGLEERSLVLDARGGRTTTDVREGFAGAAISPNGEWAAYAIVTGQTMQVLRVPTRNEIPLR